MMYEWEGSMGGGVSDWLHMARQVAFFFVILRSMRGQKKKKKTLVQAFVDVTLKNTAHLNSVSAACWWQCPPHRQCVLLHSTNRSRKAQRPLKRVWDVSQTTKFQDEAAAIRTGCQLLVWRVPKWKPCECLDPTSPSKTLFLSGSYCDSFDVTGLMIQWVWFTEDLDPVNINLHPGWSGSQVNGSESVSSHINMCFHTPSRRTTGPRWKSPILIRVNWCILGAFTCALTAVHLWWDESGQPFWHIRIGKVKSKRVDHFHSAPLV